MKPLKVLILTASAGAGHISCANALKEALLKRDGGSEVKMVDMFQLSKATSKNGQIHSLLSICRLYEVVFNLFHILIDRYKWFANLAEFIALRPMYKPTMRLLEEYKPDIVVGNNAMLIPEIDRCRKKMDFKYIVTVTDLITVCRWWASPLADIVFVPTEEAEKTLRKYTPNCNLVRDYFSFREIKPLSEKESAEVFDHFFSQTAFSPEKPLVLITGGGFATRKIIRGIRRYIESSAHQFAILAGRDEKLYKELEEEFGGSDNVVVFGFTQRNLELMAIADVVISKFGSVSVVEIEEMNKKAIFTTPVGHQEYGNIEYIKRNRNFVFVGSNYRQVVIEIERFLIEDYEPSTAHIGNADRIVEYVFSNIG